MHAKPGKIIITLLLFLVACSLLLAAFVNYAGYTRRSREEDAFRELEQSAAVGAQMMDTSLREMNPGRGAVESAGGSAPAGQPSPFKPAAPWAPVSPAFPGVSVFSCVSPCISSVFRSG